MIIRLPSGYLVRDSDNSIWFYPAHGETAENLLDAYLYNPTAEVNAALEKLWASTEVKAS
jgi:hypothetical protein